MSYFDKFKSVSHFKGEGTAEQNLFLAQQAFDKYFEGAIDKVKGIIYNEITEYDTGINYDTGYEYSDIQYEFILQHLIYGERFNDEKLMITKNDVNAQIGSYVSWDNKTWLITNQENRAIKTHKVFKINLCNNILVWQEPTGKVRSMPCFIKDEGLGQQDDSRKVPISVSKRVVKMQWNNATSEIYQNQRFIFSKKHAFMATEIDDFTQPNLPYQQGVLTLKLERTQVMEADNLLANIAFNGSVVTPVGKTDVLWSRDSLVISQFNTGAVNVTEYSNSAPTATVFTFRVDGIPADAYTIISATGNSITLRADKIFYSGTLVAIKPDLSETSIPMTLKSFI
jgi:hypothetical protein